MRLHIQLMQPDRMAIDMEGSLDYRTVPGIRKRLLKSAGSNAAGKVTINLHAVPAMDSAGIALLVEVLRVISSRGATLDLEGLSDQVKRMVRLTRLDQAFQLNDR